jgi:type IV pilus assembly protein PilY1
MDGNLWRFEVEDNPDPGSWHKTRLFKGDQPITATPTLAFGYNEDVLIYFGTGAYLVPDDILETDQQSFYCIKDKHEDNSLERADLVDQTSTIHDMGTADGWYVDLWHDTGERVTEQALVVAGVVFFTSYAPLSDVCQAGGHSWLYSMSYDDGSAVEDEDGNELPRDEDLGDGIASRPVADIVNETAVIQSSDATISVVDIAPAIFHLSVVSWQENYDFVVEPPEGNP